ncbi:hypothetical protein ACRAWD_25760 [Caulobacter segnis]
MAVNSRLTRAAARGHGRDLHRSGHRPRSRRRRRGRVRHQEEPAPAGHRRPARSAVLAWRRAVQGVAGGYLVQSRDDARIKASDLKIVTAPAYRGTRLSARTSPVRLHRRQARQVQRHRLRRAGQDPGRRGRPDESRPSASRPCAPLISARTFEARLRLE